MQKAALLLMIFSSVCFAQSRRGAVSTLQPIRRNLPGEWKYGAYLPQ